MSKFQKVSLFLMRIAFGWMMFYAGITKLMDPNWSAAGYLRGAKTFPAFFEWFLQPGILPITNFINEWGLTLLGVSLILGIGVRFSSILGAMLMMLYYFPVLEFPRIAPHSYLVDDHIIDAVGLLVLAALRAGRAWGLERWFARLPFFQRFQSMDKWFG